jgi:hypothetical protein
MIRWHASTELRLTTATVVAKTVYLAARYMGRLESGRVLGLGTESMKSADTTSAELDTSG